MCITGQIGPSFYYGLQQKVSLAYLRGQSSLAGQQHGSDKSPVFMGGAACNCGGFGWLVSCCGPSWSATSCHIAGLFVEAQQNASSLLSASTAGVTGSPADRINYSEVLFYQCRFDCLCCFYHFKFKAQLIRSVCEGTVYVDIRVKHMVVLLLISLGYSRIVTFKLKMA